MHIQNIGRASVPAPASHGVLTAKKWSELHDFLSLALDALGEKPEDFNPDFLANAVLHQKLAAKITLYAARRIGGSQ